MHSNNTGLLTLINHHITVSVQAAQRLLSVRGMTGLNSIRGDSKLAGQIHDSLRTHATTIVTLGNQWSASYSAMKADVVHTADVAEALLRPREITSKSQLQARLDQVKVCVGTVKSLSTHVDRFNSGFTSMRGALQGDARSIAAALKSERQQLATLQKKIAKYNRDHAPTAKHVCEEIGKAIVSFGGWAIADAIDAKREADTLNTELRSLQVEMPALRSVQTPLDDLSGQLGSLSTETANLVAATEEVANKLTAIAAQAARINPESYWFEVQLAAIRHGLERLQKLARTFATQKAVVGVYRIPADAGLVWRDVPDEELRATFSPPLTAAQLSDFKWWSQAAARWGSRQQRAAGETFLTGVPTYEVGNVGGKPVRGVMLIPRTLGAVWRDITDDDLLRMFPNGLTRAQLEQPRFWASAINRFAIRQRDPSGTPYVFGLPTWEVGSNHRPVRGALLFPASSGILWANVPTVELELTFSPQLSDKRVEEPRYWAAATARWAQKAARAKGFSFAIPSWEVGAEPI